MKSNTSNNPSKKAMDNNQKKAAENKKIDEAISESFPASDPPAWYAGKDKKKSPTK